MNCQKYWICFFVIITFFTNFFSAYAENLHEKKTRPKDQIRPRILGGKEATPGAWPWMVAIVLRSESNLADGQFCGGTLIHPYWVVTAAHCFDEETAATVDVVLGVHDLLNPGANITRIKVAEIINHPFYNSDITTQFDGDITLLRLESPVNNIEPMKIISDESLDDPGVNARVIGWGLTTDGGSSSPELLEVELPIATLAAANATDNFGQTLTEDLLPAGFAAGNGKDSCQGDSGGPLIVRNKNNDGWELAGVVSFGPPAGCGTSYGIYSRITFWQEWLDTTMHPRYAEWATRKISPNLSRSLNGDSDNDGISNFQEFAFESDPMIFNNINIPKLNRRTSGNKTYPDITFFNPTNTDLKFDVEQSTNLTNWSKITSAAVETMTVTPDTSNDSRGGQNLTFISEHSLDDNNSAFLRVNLVTESPSAFIGFNSGNELVYKGNIDSSFPADPGRTGTYYMKEIFLDKLPTDTDAVIQSISDSFTPYLAIINLQNNSVMHQQNGSGNTATLTFRPQASMRYKLRISSVEQSRAGPVSLNYPPRN